MLTGAGCREASAFLEKALGQQQDEQLTSEFYASQPEVTRTHAS
ncbi:MAG: DUF2997 domain-containing protein [Planctomycetota bacterium]